jgi:uncharacterized protein YjhX (UPF0386 family)
MSDKKKKKKYANREGMVMDNATGENVFAKLDKKKLIVMDENQQQPLRIILLAEASVRGHPCATEMPREIQLTYDCAAV